MDYARNLQKRNLSKFIIISPNNITAHLPTKKPDSYCGIIIPYMSMWNSAIFNLPVNASIDITVL